MIGPRHCRGLTASGGERDVSGPSQLVVAVDGFNGPFDLLVRLIDQRELDLLTISLAAVTEQYLDHLSVLGWRDPEHLSAFLVVAAKLLLVKSTLLLPRPARALPDEPVAPDPTDLTERLRVYRQFRQAAEMLAGRDDAGLRSYGHPAVLYRAVTRPAAMGLDPEKLRTAWRALNARVRPEAEPTTIEAGRVSVAEVRRSLEAALGRYSEVAFGSFVAAEPSRQRYVATFLAVLELIRLGLANASQDEQFGSIMVTRREIAPTKPNDDATEQQGVAER
jgi:segregation and condensation protein A